LAHATTELHRSLVERIGTHRKSGLHLQKYRRNGNAGSPEIAIAMSKLTAAMRSSSLSRDIWISLGVGALVFLLICALSSLSQVKGIDNFFMVGMLFAALFFPDGIHSDFGLTFLAIGLLTDLLVLSLPAFIVIRLVSRWRGIASRPE
jgi:hypothetical protein